MRTILLLTAALALGAWSGQAGAKPFQIINTSWAYVEHGKKVRETIDADGNYMENAVSGKHVDH